MTISEESQNAILSGIQSAASEITGTKAATDKLEEGLKFLKGFSKTDPLTKEKLFEFEVSRGNTTSAFEINVPSGTGSNLKITITPGGAYQLNDVSKSGFSGTDEGVAKLLNEIAQRATKEGKIDFTKAPPSSTPRTPSP